MRESIPLDVVTARLREANDPDEALAVLTSAYPLPAAIHPVRAGLRERLRRQLARVNAAWQAGQDALGEAARLRAERSWPMD